MTHGFDHLMVIDHPLVQHKMAVLRDEGTSEKPFRELVHELTVLVGYEATRNRPLREVDVQTPVAVARCRKLAGKEVVVIPILRAGLGMVSGLMELMPNCVVGHLGMYRNEETLEPVPYYSNYPRDIAERDVIVVDPMLATGGSASAAVSFIKDQGAKNISLICIVAAREGVERLYADHPDVKVYAASFDEELTPKAYITPGLGDAGDRLFGTL